MDIKLQFNKDWVGGRTWVNKDKFPQFHLEYQNSQDESSLTNTSNVQFGIHINMIGGKGEKKQKDMDSAYDRVWRYQRRQTVY